MSEKIQSPESVASPNPSVFLGGGREAVSTLPEHLYALPGGDWRIWRCVGVRGAGFPASLPAELADAAGSAAADAVLDAERQAEQELEVALNALRQHLEGSDREMRDTLLTAIQRLKKGREVKGEEALPSSARAPLSALRSARASLSVARSGYEAAFASALSSNSEALRRLASDPRLREAVTWQNRAAARTALRPLAEGGSRGSKRRQQEALAASYLQRYALKNDTIGFFGPMGWARVVDEGDTVSLKPGAGLLAAREVRYESWCVDAVASRLSEDARLRPWLAPRRVPFVAVEGEWLRGGRQAVRLGAREAEALRLCEGALTGRGVARALAVRGLVSGEAEGLRVLEGLLARGLISWALEAPLSLHPERALREALERVEDADLRANALGVLDELEEARSAVARAAGDAEALDRAVGELEETFTRLTGTAPTRAAGKTYAARTLVYEDCRRDVDVELGPDFIEAIGEPLSLLLTGARWFTYEASKIYRATFRKVYAGLARAQGSRVVDATVFWQQVQPLLFSKGPRPVDALVNEFQRKWQEVLRVEPGARRADYRSSDLRAKVEAEFAAPGPGWRSACYHSPDVMVEAAGAEALRRGEYRIVLGELHIGGNTFKPSCFFAQHPRPEELIAALDSDIPEPRLVPVTPKNWPHMNSRTQPMLISQKDFRLLVSPDAYTHTGARILRVGELVVEEAADGIFLRSLDGSFRSEILEACAEAFTSHIIQRFHILGPGAHTPRVSIDGVVVCREAWRFEAEDASFAFERHEADRFLGARRFARRLGAPRHAFAKVPVEVKPFYVDFDSPAYVEMLARMVRRTAEAGRGGVSLSEMLPRASGAWLEDSEGRRYTSELRIVAVDLLK
jgi:hypothetical protein